MKANLFNTRLLAGLAALLTCTSSSHAVSTALDGVYAGTGTATQILVSRGRPVSNSILNNHQEFVQTFMSVTDSVNSGGLKIDYSFQESKGQSTFTVRYYDPSDGSLLGTFTSTIKVTVTEDTTTSFKTTSEWSMSVSTTYGGSFTVPPLTVDEEYRFDASKFTCMYTCNSASPYLTNTTYPTKVSSLMKRINTGSGNTQTSPFVPGSPVWSRPTAVNFPVIKPNSTIWCDPPYAPSFQYSIAAGRSERMATVTLPKGFGTKIQVLAQPSAGGSARLLGTFSSGSKVDLLKQKGIEKGTSQLIIRGIAPKVDVASKAPYPVGLTFTNMKEAAVKLSIQAKETTAKR
jgi:hypothetical protein